jgi:hypothetical protein
MVFESKKPLDGAILASRCPIAYGQAGEDERCRARVIAGQRAWTLPVSISAAP